MVSTYQLITLGSLHVEGQVWRPAKALTLVAYLGLEGPTPRRRLRELFWPDARDPGASLRVVLDNLRRHLPGIVSGNETLETAAGSDAAALLGREAGEVEGESFYTGAFLADTDLSEVSGELEEWIVATRERLAVAARLAALRTAELAGSPAEAGQWAERAASVAGAPPLEPGEMERLLRLSLPGSRLETELRQELAEYSGSPAPARPAVSRPELLGRERELELLLLALSEGHNRLIEITGAGGIGKSTLAAALLREQADLSGVPLLSVPLETAQSSSEAAARMVVALRLQVTDRGDGWLALARAWGERPLLVLLDGAEGLPELGRGVETLLAHCPGVRVVVTSRVQRLNGAVHLALDGLSVPAAGEPLERVARSAAAQLFVRGARRYLPNFTLDAAHAPLVAAIVRRLDGHPLATVLSATWMRVYPPARIHTLLLQDLTALRAESGGSERHQLSAVFERSWQLLTPDEAQAIAALAVFQGFSPVAALEVAGVDDDLLRRLSHHSLLREQSSGSGGQRRLEVPPVLAAQAQAHLPDAQAVLDAHAAYYLNHLMTYAPESDEVDIERANIVAALGYAVSQGRDVAREIDTLLSSYDRRGLLDSGTDAFYALQEAIHREDSETLGSILVGLAWLAWRAARYVEAERFSLDILSNHIYDGTSAYMKACNIMSNLLRVVDSLEKSLEYLEKSRIAAEERHDTQRYTIYSLNLAGIYLDLGMYDETWEIIRDTLNKYEFEMDEMRRMEYSVQGILANYYSNKKSLSEQEEEINRFLISNSLFKKAQIFHIARIAYIRVLIRHGKLQMAESEIKRLIFDGTQNEYREIKVAARIERVKLLYAKNDLRHARAEALKVLLDTVDIGIEKSTFEAILAFSEDLSVYNTDLANRVLNFIVESKKSTHYQKQAARLQMTDDSVAPHATPVSLSSVLDEIQAALRHSVREL